MATLASRDHQDLINNGLATPAAPDGTVRIHKRRLHQWADAEYAHLPLSPTPPESSEDHFTTIPAARISLATLKYLGFNSERADEIWTRWQNWPLNPIVFLQFVMDHLEDYVWQDVYDEDDDEWFRYMDLCGINEELQKAIMDPEFKSMRLMETCLYWLKDTMELRYMGLERIEATSREREQAL
ncbi:hypothetical protein UVI_02055210 [Ustilaginoidea virens]|nr:hypothetical protein UVI_02055210 [Ustilaginoidea virens]